MHQRGGLDRLARTLPGQPGLGQASQLVVDDLEQPVGGPPVAGLDRVQDARDVGHGASWVLGLGS